MSTREKPILMSAPMVRAILDGKKTQTRRVVNAARGEQREWFTPELMNSSPSAQMYPGGAQFEHPGGGSLGFVSCPYGQLSERLWVRENFWFDTREPNECVIYSEDQTKFQYRTGGKGVQDRRQSTYSPNACEDDISKNKFWKQKPSIFMPRWASRITLEITGVRVERLRCITEEDAKSEGVKPETYFKNEKGEVSCICSQWLGGDPVPRGYHFKYGFERIWHDINGTKSWDANPWVWVVEFKRVSE